jgi:hypothetical protein
MNDYKKQYSQRRSKENAKWRKKHNAEIKIIQEKNNLLDKLYDIENNMINTSNKIQAF